MLGSCCSFAVIVASTDGMSAPFTFRVSTVPPVNPRLDAGASVLERDRALLLDDADDLLRAFLA